MNKKATIDDVYESCCSYYGRMPEPDQARVWFKILSKFPASIVEAALLQWQQNSDEDRYTNKPVGKFAPTAADIKAIIEANERKAVSANKYVPCGIGGCLQGLVAYKKDGSLWNWRTDQEESRYWRDCECKIEWRERTGKITAQSVRQDRKARAGQ